VAIISVLSNLPERSTRKQHSPWFFSIKLHVPTVKAQISALHHQLNSLPTTVSHASLNKLVSRSQRCMRCSVVCKLDRAHEIEATDEGQSCESEGIGIDESFAPCK